MRRSHIRTDTRFSGNLAPLLPFALIKGKFAQARFSELWHEPTLHVAILILALKALFEVTYDYILLLVIRTTFIAPLSQGDFPPISKSQLAYSVPMRETDQ